MSRFDELEAETARVGVVLELAGVLLAALDTNDDGDDALIEALGASIEEREARRDAAQAELDELLRVEYDATEREGWAAYQAR